MTRRHKVLFQTDSLPVSMASGRTARGKPMRRKTKSEDEHGRVDTGMTEEQWYKYLYEEESSPTHAVRRYTPFSATSEALGLRQSDWNSEKYREAYQRFLIVSPSDEEESGAKQISDGIFIVAPGGPGEKHSQRFLAVLDFHKGEELKVIEPFDPKKRYAKYWMTSDMKQALERSGLTVVWDDEQGRDENKLHYKIGPGNNTVSDLEEFLDKFSGRGVEIVFAYNHHHGFCVILCTPKAAAGIGKRGFEIEELEAPVYPYVD